jgi:uncharacterized protein
MAAKVANTSLELALSGRWDDFCAQCRREPSACATAVRRDKSPGGEYILHLAAAAGRDDSASLCVRYGADVNAPDSTGSLASETAARHGFVDLARRLEGAALSSSWRWDVKMPAFPDPAVFPASNRWREARAVRAAFPRSFSYAGGEARIARGGVYYADSWGRGIVGWHGSTDPPCGMDGEPMIDRAVSSDDVRNGAIPWDCDC